MVFVLYLMELSRSPLQTTGTPKGKNNENDLLKLSMKLVTLARTFPQCKKTVL
jgi:hypothetical protein